MNILLINHYAGSVHHGMEYRPYYLAREWIKQGHKVMILASSYSHIRTKNMTVEANYTDELIDGIHYRWYKTPEHKGNGIGRVKNIISFLRKVGKDANSITESFKPDAVIASSTYPMDIWSARRIAKQSNAMLVYEVHDLWPLSPIELGNMSRWHPFIIWCQIAENHAYKYADKIVSMLPKTKSHMVKHGMKPEKFHYIPNGVNLDEWSTIAPLPDDVSQALLKIKQKGLPIIGYAGTFGLANALDCLLDVAKQEKNSFEIVLIGKGPEKQALQKRIKAENISNVTILSSIPKTSMPSFLKSIDIAYIGLLPQPLFRFGISPNKLIDYMMAAKPIIMAIDAGNDIVSDVGCGITTLPSDVKAIGDAIMKLSKLPSEELKKMGEKGNDFILSNQTYPVLAEQFITLLEKPHDR